MTFAVCRLLARRRARAAAEAVVPSRRLFSADAVAHAARRVQVYVSRSHDPYLNLSVEHYLLQNSAPESVVLFLYTNRPCVVIGRNQNPWLEVNLGLLDRPGLLAPAAGRADEGVQLVRRRSGGGTVFHDYGNMNYSVICPPAAFDRNKHAEMVVRALRALGVATAHVNERHDIVVDGGPRGSGAEGTFKVSGSAYKLTRLRSLHHGTCLLSTPNLDRIGQFLRSPAEPYIKARGVESVRSRIRNVGVDNRAFEEAVVAEFAAMYGRVDVDTVADVEKQNPMVPQVAKGYAELKSPEWIYTQTPQFTFSTHPSDEDPRARPTLPENLPEDFHLSLTARHGQISQAHGTVTPSPLDSLHLHGISDWRSFLGEAAGDWLNIMFGVRQG